MLKPETADTAFPEGDELDVVDLLLTQHARIEELFTLAVGLTGAARRDAFDDLARLLTIHEAAEQEIVHPLSRTLGDGGDALADDRLAEEHEASQILKELATADPDDDGFVPALLILREAVLRHAKYEERYEFPQLRAKVPADRLRALATAVRTAETSAVNR